MRILHIAKKYPDALGGDAVVVANLKKQQLKAGHHVAVITTNCVEIRQEQHLYKVGLLDTPADLDNITLRRLLSLVALFFKSFAIIRAERPDVIHSHSVDMAAAVSLAARLYNVPVVHTFHVVTFHDANQSTLRRRTELRLEKLAGPKLVTAPDEADVAHLRGAGVDNAVLLPNGIDLDFWGVKAGVTKEKVFTFISAGRLEEQKGYEYLVRAAANLKRRTSKKFRVVIAGEGSLQGPLETLAVHLGVDDIVSFVGRKKPEVLRELYQSSHVAVFPSLWEAAALTIYEAWASGLPIVTTPAGIFQGEPSPSPRVQLADIKHTSSLAKAMLTVMNSAAYRRELAKAGKAQAAMHSWGKIANEADAVYAKAAGH